MSKQRHGARRKAAAGRTPKRDRAKLKRAQKRRLGLTRRDIGAIGAGHLDPPNGYVGATGP